LNGNPVLTSARRGVSTLDTRIGSPSQNAPPPARRAGYRKGR
jgi:hypothetical protein